MVRLIRLFSEYFLDNKQISAIAENYFQSGFNCAEPVWNMALSTAAGCCWARKKSKNAGDLLEGSQRSWQNNYLITTSGQSVDEKGNYTNNSRLLPLGALTLLLEIAERRAGLWNSLSSHGLVAGLYFSYSYDPASVELASDGSP